MIYYICMEIMVFLLVFLIAIIGCANMFYVMQGVAVNLGSDQADSEIVG
jgi:hypothetical protein